MIVKIMLEIVEKPIKIVIARKLQTTEAIYDRLPLRPGRIAMTCGLLRGVYPAMVGLAMTIKTLSQQSLLFDIF
ncbi:hypothetical protein COS66_02675 [Candidatus Berkelbacteria bacterium CG06_land_8_20_14_3_00_43_10]|nr:MAG: hypothetical protein AUK41_01695 [Candidatus Berkelbacteria bacterium CG2_30_43_20]PIU87110.1 MAG: hypothetical protein COS66_02675 [Candidatus Berkelbacteria bacterium CG06_land_8_20_14_3_00_43_10]